MLLVSCFVRCPKQKANSMITQKVPLPLQDISTRSYKNYRVEAAINPRTNKKTHTPTVVKGGGGGGQS